jgi:hypothetical protein
MHLYDCRLGTFIPQASTGQIADILRGRFVERMAINPSESEVKSWRNSLGSFAEAVTCEGMDDAWIVLEYQLPLSSRRIDSMVIGGAPSAGQNAVLLEFKQWDRCDPSPVPEVVRVGGQDVLHPSAQVRNYRDYLRDAHSAFSDTGIGLWSCAYLHCVMQRAGSPFFDPRYTALLKDAPLFCGSDVDKLASFLRERTGGGASADLVESIVRGEYKPSKKLLDHVASSVAGHAPWRLLDEQQLVFNEIMGDIAFARQSGEKHVVIVRGGPGTGKSVIALQVLGVAAHLGYGVVHATGSKAFTTNLRGIVSSTPMFQYFNNFTKTRPNSIELVVCDEAHRLRETSATRWQAGSDRPQVGEIIDTAKVAVFLLDGAQSVRGNEVGSVDLIEGYAAQHGIPVSKYDLSIQFRTSGSESYINWVDSVLGLNKSSSLVWKTESQYGVKVFDKIEGMEAALRAKVALGASARIIAGFCWPWSDPVQDRTLQLWPDPRGDYSLYPDVTIGGWARPWNRKPRDMWRIKGSAEPPARHPYTIWASEPEGFDQIGCIYSAQGFEFDYVGVIIGSDLRWDVVGKRWAVDLKANRAESHRMGQWRSRD